MNGHSRAAGTVSPQAQRRANLPPAARAQSSALALLAALALLLLFSGVARGAVQTTSLVSVSSTGAAANGESFEPAISSNGRFVAFASEATKLVEGDTNNRTDIFLRDRKSGVTTRISVAEDGTQANDNCFSPRISADGRFIYFLSSSTSLVEGPEGAERRIYRYDRESGTLSLVPLPAGIESVTGTYAVDADGGRVAFEAAGEVYVWDAETDEVELASETATGTASMPRSPATGPRSRLRATRPISTHPTTTASATCS
jgi:Tol biopolymer transport system component